MGLVNKGNKYSAPVVSASEVRDRRTHEGGMTLTQYADSRGISRKVIEHKAARWRADNNKPDGRRGRLYTLEELKEIEQSPSAPTTYIKKRVTGSDEIGYTIMEYSRKEGIPYTTIYGHMKRRSIPKKDRYSLEEWKQIMASTRHRDGTTLKEWAEIKGVGVKCLTGHVLKWKEAKGIPSNQHINYTEEMIDEALSMKRSRGRKTGTTRVHKSDRAYDASVAEYKRKLDPVYWKLSVFDERLFCFIVKAVCLEASEAIEMKTTLEQVGIVCRVSPHITKAYEGRRKKQFDLF